MLVAPGLQRALYGAGDVEGVRVVYEVSTDGSLRLEDALADNATHDPVPLSREQALALDRERHTFYSSVWSHQLGGHGARARSDLAYVRCYDDDAIRPLPDSIAQSFRVEHRARPAHVEWSGGRRLDVKGAPLVRLGGSSGEAAALPPGHSG